MAQLITIGEILVEFMAAKTGQTFLKAGHFRGPYASGAPAIMIDQAARLGASCCIIACVGKDDFGALNVNRLKSDGVDVRGIIVKDDETTGVAFVAYASDGSRKFIFHFSHAASGSLKPEEVNEQIFSDVKIFHIMGCSLCAGQSLHEAVMHGARLAKEKGALISFDPNVRPELLEIDGVRTVFSWILETCDILLTSKKELEEAANKTVEEAIRAYQGKQAIVIRDGKNGTRVIADGIDQIVPSFIVNELDPTGAGDCFDGAFLAMLLAGKPLAEAVRTGNAAGALSVTKRGPMEGAARPDEIKAMMY